VGVGVGAVVGVGIGVSVGAVVGVGIGVDVEVGMGMAVGVARGSEPPGMRGWPAGRMFLWLAVLSAQEFLKLRG
jgi:hypothetical protein